MSVVKVGILHPGEMGVFVAASARNSGCEVYWVSEKRSEKTRQRAEKHGLLDAGTLAALCQTCSIILSVLPPHAAENVAEQVIAQGYCGVYVDANAISPSRSIEMSKKMNAAGVNFVDGGIIGGPDWEHGKTRLYLAGENAGRVVECFPSGPLQAIDLDGAIGRASSLKMCYAAYTKGTTALLCAILATAEHLGVREELEAQWAYNWPGFDEQARRRVRRVTAKAWRFAGEMEEISTTFSDAGLPGGFHTAAKEIYLRLTGFKDAESTPELEQVLHALQTDTTSG